MAFALVLTLYKVHDVPFTVGIHTLVMMQHHDGFNTSFVVQVLSVRVYQLAKSMASWLNSTLPQCYRDESTANCVKDLLEPLQ